MRDMPTVDEIMDARDAPAAPVLAAVLFTSAGGLALRPLQGATAEEVALIGRIALVGHFLVEPEVIRNLIEPAGSTAKQ
jgi:hypothetical protein